MKHLTWSRALIVISLFGIGIGIKPVLKSLHPHLVPDDFVEVKVSFSDDGSCAKEFPLLIEIHNHSPRTVAKVDTWVSMKMPGRSSELMPPGTAHTSDIITLPGKSNELCWRLPRTDANKTWVYTVDRKEIHFQ
jgi:hypothetical protein